MLNKHITGSCSVFGITLTIKGIPNSTFRRRTERHSSNGWSSKQHLNEFTTGFKIGSTYTHAKNSYGYYIIDPRGYTIPISTDNLGDILRDSVVDHGLITTPCIWDDNGELKTQSQYDAYNKSESTKYKPTYLKMGKIPIGTVVNDENGRQYIWMGAYHTIVEHAGELKWSSSKVQYTIDVRVPRTKKKDGKRICDDLRNGVLQTSVIKFVEATEDSFEVDDAKAIINHMLYDKHTSKQKLSRKYVADKQFDFSYRFIERSKVQDICIFQPTYKRNHIYRVSSTTGVITATWTPVKKTIYHSDRPKYAEVIPISTHKFRYKNESNNPISLRDSIVCNIVLWNNDTNEMLSFFKEESVEGD